MHVWDTLAGIRPILDSHMKVLCLLMLLNNPTDELPSLVELEDLRGFHVSQLGYDSLWRDQHMSRGERSQVHKCKH